MPLGRWVLDQACRQAQAWLASGHAHPDFYMSVNLSGRQLQDPELVHEVASAIRDSGLPARALVLEVTESVLVDDFDASLARLRALKGLGLRLAVDDFGTGYSSLSYLRDLPVDVIKIDKSFIDRVAVDPEGAAVVRSVIDMAAALGLTSIAEGVEDAEQLACLDAIGCDNVQGFLLARPMPVGESANALTKLNGTEPAPTTRRTESRVLTGPLRRRGASGWTVVRGPGRPTT